MKWKIDNQERYAKCPQCYFKYDIWNNRSQGIISIFKYCPNCGEKMTNKKKER